MGTISEKLTYLNDTRLKIKDGLNKFGADLTENDTFRSYSNVLNDIYDKLPKVSGNGSNFSLENAQNGKLDLFEMEGNTIQGRLPSEYTQVDYIESSGNQYIDTGVNADSNLRVVLDIAYTSPTSANQNIGAIILTPQTLRYHLLSSPTAFRMYSYQSDVGVGDVDTNRHLFDFDIPNRKVYFDGNEFDKPSNDFDLGINFYLFGRNSTGSIYLSKVKQWACKMYYNNVLVRDFIPCYRNSDNEVGLYDLVNDIFYTNQGTGVFTYGALAPTPDSPIDIEVVENKQVVNVSGKNLCDIKQLKLIVNLSGKVVANNTFSNAIINTRNINSLYISGNYSLLGDGVIRIGVFSEYPVLNTQGTRITYSSNSALDTTNYNYVLLCFTPSTNHTIEEIKNSFMVNEGSSATPYEPYHNQDYEIDLHGKNLFDKNTSNILIGYTSSVITSQSGSRTLFIKCKPNTTYTISRSKCSNRFQAGTSETIPQIGTTLSNLTPSSFVNNGTSITITTPTNANYLCVFYSQAQNNLGYTEEELRNSIQIEESSTPTEYEEFYDYKLCKIGDYKDVIFKNNQLSSYYGSTLDEDGWYIKRNALYVNGIDLGWRKGGGQSYSDSTIFYDTSKIASNISVFNILCTHLKYANIYASNSMGIAIFSSNEIGIRMLNTIASTVDELNNWLINNDVKILLPLATPTYEKITNSTLINQLEAIETETGTNIFEVSNENNVLPSLNVKRLKEFDKLS